ncbi:hypothetical protein MMC16_001916 [Acarospora aff. strigata]|nr:hypothetical protein [Acarospora aff. strigata]
MPPVKRRKLTATTSKHSSFVPAQRKGIQAFGKVTKAVRPTDNAAKKEQRDAVVSINHTVEEQTAGCTNSKKRKLITVHEIQLEEQPRPSVTNSVQYSSSSSIVQLSASPDTNTPPEDLPTKLAPPSSSDIPTKGATAYLETLGLESPRNPCNSSLLSIKPSSHPSIERSSLESNDPPDYCPHVLPEELLDLVNLNSAFLTALSLHYAHHGCFTPADLRLLTPSIERAWGKRKVSVEDIRRTLGLLKTGSSLEHKGSQTKAASVLKLSDYGNGRLCIEVTGLSTQDGFMARPIDESSLNYIFLRNLRLSWRTWVNNPLHHKSKSSAYIAGLPLPPVNPCSSLHKISPLLLKGQRRLEDLKAGTICVTERDPLTPFSTDNEHHRQKAPGTGSRKTSLLNRIKAKEFHQSTLPAPPSQASVGRKSALQRLDEVVPVLNILTNNSGDNLPACDLTRPVSATEQKITITLPTLVQTLQNSLRNPISKAEGELCVALLAEEVAPEWVQLVRLGKVVGVVVNRGMRLGTGEMRSRLAALLV